MVDSHALTLALPLNNAGSHREYVSRTALDHFHTPAFY